MADDELWKAWAMLSHQLAESESLSAPKRELCAQVHETIRRAILSSRGL